MNMRSEALQAALSKGGMLNPNEPQYQQTFPAKLVYIRSADTMNRVTLEVAVQTDAGVVMHKIRERHNSQALATWLKSITYAVGRETKGQWWKKTKQRDIIEKPIRVVLCNGHISSFLPATVETP